MGQAAEQKFQISGMSCAGCAGRVETALVRADGITGVHVNLATNIATVTSALAPQAIAAVITQAGYPAEPMTDQTRVVLDHEETAQGILRQFVIAACLTAPVFALEMGGHIVPAIHHLIARTIGLQASWVIQFILATLVLIGPGRVFFTKGLPALWRRAPDMNALVVMGAGAAWTYSTLALFAPGLFPTAARAVYFEAAAVIVTLILLGRWLEARAKGQTGAAIERLIDLRPDTATVVRAGQEETLPLSELVIGDIIILRPGTQIPTDGVVTQGASHIDESMVTGEPVPVAKSEGDTVVGGTINGNGALQIRATAIGADTMLSRIIAMVEDAQDARLPVQDLVTKITVWFVPAIMGIAAVTVLLWLVFGPAPVLSHALVAGVSVLIIACPCAMGLAVPMSIMVGTGRAADLGVLFRQGDALQELAGIDTVAFDKTGTLTLGQPSVTDIDDLTGDKDQFLRKIAALETLSEHPLASAIIATAQAPFPGVTEFRAIPGHGLRGMVDGQLILVGAQRLLEAEGVDPSALVAFTQAHAQAGKTPIMVAIDGKAAGVIAVSDQLRPAAKTTISLLQAMGKRVALVTGDAEQTAKAIGAQLGIQDIFAEVLPAGKVDVVRQLQAGGAKVAFVGDGINDAPALAAAQVGIAIGTGTDVAVQSADVVLMSGDPEGVLNGLAISTATMANIKQNLIWAFGYNVLLVPVAAGALFPVFGMLLSPGLAAGAMALSSVLVVTNALRLRGVKGT